MSAASRSKKAGMKKRPIPPACPKCGHKQAIRSGHVQKMQRWKCKACSYQYTRAAPRGRPLWQKSLAVFFYSYGMSMHAIARIFHIQPSTVMKWVQSYAKEYQPAPESGDILMMEFNDMRRHLKKISDPKAGMLCIAIDDATFKKNIGISIRKR